MRNMKSRTHLNRTARSAGIPALLVLAACAAGWLVPALSSADEGRHDRRGEERQRQYQHQHQYQNQYENQRRPMRHRYPVYVPPPIYYPHYESPGINIVIPFDLR
jgi:hypothetical protein